MADEGLTIRGINWKETFPFTNIFRAFRIAIHPSKILLALAALILIYIGGSVLDAVWPAGQSVVYNIEDGKEMTELDAFVQMAAADDTSNFSDARKQVRERVIRQHKDRLRKLAISDLAKAEDLEKAANAGSYLGNIKEDILKRRDKDGTVLKDRFALVDQSVADKSFREGYEARIARQAAEIAINEMFDQATKGKTSESAEYKAAEETRKKAREAADKTRDDAVTKAKSKYDAEEEKKKLSETESKFKADAVKSLERDLKRTYAAASLEWKTASTIRGKGVFDTFLSYQVSRVNAAAQAVINGRLLGAGSASEAITHFFTIGPVWLIKAHPVYAILFFAWFFGVWAIFGGAIARITAVHVARDEKISIRSAIQFSVSKFLSFFCAPLIPLGIVLAIGLLIAIGGVLYAIPWVGPIVGGVVFFLALLGGLVITLILIGTSGGFTLMYPTIAVEGSDSFDAISRSFSYVYARPWRLLFYSVVAIIYFSITYFFVRVFLYVLLSLTHYFVNFWYWKNAANSQSAFEVMWPGPTDFWRLTYQIDWFTLDPMQSTGAFILAISIFTTVALAGAFAISMYFSLNTLIYVLMRKEVDATDLTEVFVESTDDDFSDAPATAPAAATPAPAAATPAASSAGASPATIVGTPPPQIGEPPK